MTTRHSDTSLTEPVTISILINIDADRIKQKYPRPSTNRNEPTGIAHNEAYMVAAAPNREIRGQGTGDLILYAQVNDIVHAWATTPSRNVNNCVLLYGMPRFRGDQVLDEFKYHHMLARTVEPYSASEPLPPEGKPPREEPRTFYVYTSRVVRKGSEGYAVKFALYTRKDDGTHERFGYFGWDPEFIVR